MRRDPAPTLTTTPTGAWAAKVAKDQPLGSGGVQGWSVVGGLNESTQPVALTTGWAIRNTRIRPACPRHRNHYMRPDLPCHEADHDLYSLSARHS